MSITKKKIKSALTIALLCLCAIFACVAFVPTRVLAETENPCIVLKKDNILLTTSTSITFPVDKSSIKVTLQLRDCNLQVGDKVVYSFINEENNDIMYNVIKTKDVETDNSNAEYEYDFYNNGIGTYRIKAIVLRNDKAILFPADFVLQIQAPDITSNNNSWTKTIVEPEPAHSSIGEYPTYNFEVQVKDYKKNLYDLKGYTIEWYYVLGDNERVKFGSGVTTTWTPNENGNYQIIATMKSSSTANPIEVTYEVKNVVRNESPYIIIGASILAGVLCVVVVISVVVKIKKERVW